MKKNFSKIFFSILTVFVLFFSSCATDAGKKVVQPMTRTANGAKEGVYYEIFVRSFADSNGDGIGDFNGITAKLDYLNDGDDTTTTDLGITGIWLLPIFETMSYHGYDVTNYYSINPVYGTMEDFENFLTEAKKRGITVIIDMVFNHSSVFHEWFQYSKNPESEYHSWYRWTDGNDPKYNINRKIWGHNVWNKVGDNYYVGLFSSDMPDFDASNPAVREEFKKILKFWLDKGVDGFRFDAASHIFNSSELPVGEQGSERSIEFWQEICDYARSVKPDCYLVGEVWEQTITRANFMKALQSTFHFDLGTKIVDTVKYEDGGKNSLAEAMYGDYQTYRDANPDYIDAPFLTNHDQNRVSGLLRMNAESLKMAASLYILTEGIPFIYYGEEIGMNGGARPDSGDIQIRTPFMWGGNDPYTTTWTESLYNKKTIPLNEQVKDPMSLQIHYRKLIRVKTAYEALYEGRMTPSAVDASQIVSWFMESDNQKAFVMHNVNKTETVTVEVPQAEGMEMVFASNEGVIREGNKVTIPGNTSCVFVTL